GPRPAASRAGRGSPAGCGTRRRWPWPRPARPGRPSRVLPARPSAAAPWATWDGRRRPSRGLLALRLEPVEHVLPVVIAARAQLDLARAFAEPRPLVERARGDLQLGGEGLPVDVVGQQGGNVGLLHGESSFRCLRRG